MVLSDRGNKKCCSIQKAYNNQSKSFLPLNQTDSVAVMFSSITKLIDIQDLGTIFNKKALLCGCF
jgi:hypothetical protein